MNAAGEFLAQKTLAVVEVTRQANQMGFKVYTNLKKKGYTVWPINPNTHTIMSDRCYRSLADLPGKPDGVVVILDAGKGKTVAEECHKLGIKRLWLQPGADSPSLLKLCEELGLIAVSGECVMAASRPAEQS